MAEADQSLLMPRSVSHVAVGASPQPTTPEAATGSEALVVRVHAPAAVWWCSAACHVLLRGETRSIVGNGGPACGSAALLWPGDDQCVHCHAPSRQFIGTHYHGSWQADFEAAPFTPCKFRRVCAPCALVPRWRLVGGVCACVAVVRVVMRAVVTRLEKIRLPVPRLHACVMCVRACVKDCNPTIRYGTDTLHRHRSHYVYSSCGGYTTKYIDFTIDRYFP